MDVEDLEKNIADHFPRETRALPHLFQFKKRPGYVILFYDTILHYTISYEMEVYYML